MVDELAVTLIQSEQVWVYLLYAVSQRVHLQLSQFKLLNELCSVFNRQVHVLVIRSNQCPCRRWRTHYSASCADTVRATTSRTSSLKILRSMASELDTTINLR